MNEFAESARLASMLRLEHEPVGIYLGNTEAVVDHAASPEKRNCVVPLLLSSSRGKTVSLDERSCNCAGGAVGCCFGDGFARLNPGICKMLSQGFGEDAPPNMPERLRGGERFFADEEAAQRWRAALPLSERAYPRIVFAPLGRWTETGLGEPDLVLAFANPDQLSAMVVMLGSESGRAENVMAPFCAACQSIMYAASQLDEEDPRAVMGLFDISQRNAALAGLLSLTMPYAMWEGMTRGLDRSCLTTHAWHSIEKRLPSQPA